MCKSNTSLLQEIRRNFTIQNLQLNVTPGSPHTLETKFVIQILAGVDQFSMKNSNHPRPFRKKIQVWSNSNIKKKMFQTCNLILFHISTVSNLFVKPNVATSLLFPTSATTTWVFQNPHRKSSGLVCRNQSASQCFQQRTFQDITVTWNETKRKHEKRQGETGEQGEVVVEVWANWSWGKLSWRFFDFLTIFDFLKTNDVRSINMYDHILGGVAVYRFFGKEKKHSDSWCPEIQGRQF